MANKKAISQLRKIAKNVSTIKKTVLEDGEKMATKDLKKRWNTAQIELEYESINMNNGVSIGVKGKEVIFYEFGTGITYSSLVHPAAEELGLGPGTFPGMGRWKQERGWWYEQKDGRAPANKIMVTKKGVVLGHTYGLAAHMYTYQTGIALAEYLRKKYGDK